MLAVTYNQVGFHRTPRAVKRASIWWHRKQFCAGTNCTLPRPATGEPDNEFLQSKLFSPSLTHFPTLLFELYVYAFIHQLLNYQRKRILLWKTWTIKRPKFSPSCHKLLCKTCLWLKKKKKHCPRKACIQIVRKELLSTFYGEIFLEITWAPFALSSHNLPTFAAHCFLSRIVVVTAHESSVTWTDSAKNADSITAPGSSLQRQEHTDAGQCLLQPKSLHFSSLSHRLKTHALTQAQISWASSQTQDFTTQIGIGTPRPSKMLA